VITGIGISELVVVFMLVLLFFGSKELPRIARESARFMGKLRAYSNRIRTELNDITRETTPGTGEAADTVSRKKELRTRFREQVSKLTKGEREKFSYTIFQHVIDREEYSSATAVMVYASTDSEVITDELIMHILQNGKRCILPYCKPGPATLGIAEIIRPHSDLITGKYGIREPRSDIRDNFLKSDLDLVLCPGLAFDREGNRLGRGKGYYDRFLAELSGRIPVIGICFSRQISETLFPFSYHDIAMDTVLTENGPLVADRKDI